MSEKIGLNFFGGDEHSGNVFAVETKAEAGMLLESHKHEHSHMSVLVSGTAEVTIDGKTILYSGYNLLTIPKDTQHKVVAVTDIVWLCLWADSLAPKEQAIESLNLVEQVNAVTS
jgi:quercetin dioxygenase-like cupin family protein